MDSRINNWLFNLTKDQYRNLMLPLWINEHIRKNNLCIIIFNNNNNNNRRPIMVSHREIQNIRILDVQCIHM